MSEKKRKERRSSDQREEIEVGDQISKVRRMMERSAQE